MTYLRSWNFQNIFVSLALTSFFASCSPLPTVIDAEQPTTKDYSRTKEKAYQKSLSTQFEWAIQYYESGDYERAIQQLNKLEPRGSQLKNYQEIFFYQGMTYFYLNNYPASEASLLNYLKQVNSGTHSIEAKLTLLKVYESTKQWDKILGQVAELRKTQLYHDNKALLLLIWTRSLLETNEINGAKQLLSESEQTVQQFPPKSNTYAAIGKNQDLWGRFYFTKLMLNKKLCNQEPKRTNDKTKAWLFDNWLEGESECLKNGLNILTQIYELDSQWQNESTEMWKSSLEAFFLKISNYRLKNKLGLNERRKLTTAARKSLYLLSSECDKIAKTIEFQNVNSQPLKQIQKRIETLLLSLSSPT
ncbi:MAG: hypothetical protein M9962_08255 [Oligoflexia bacterium]|nr:hypothetical protein [Oligoflexia bacterium]